MGNEISMIFQQPRSYLDPTRKIYYQIKEVLTDTSISHRFLNRVKRKKKLSNRQRVKDLLHKVGIQNDQVIMSSYPHEISEGICQKVMIAMAIANNPRVLIADEPTTAMEAVTQAQIFRLLYKLNQLHKTTILLMSNSFGSIRNISDQITLIYCGQTVESGTAKQITQNPLHPYTQAMIPQNDCVHVVKMEDDECHFERYLAAGSGHLLRPTALDVDDQGRVWIGCGNGWILRCEKLPDCEESPADNNESDDDANESVMSIESDAVGHAGPLMVENSSRSTDVQSQVSEA